MIMVRHFFKYYFGYFDQNLAEIYISKHGVSFETAATGLSQSCSCMTQLTTVADDYSKTLSG